MKIIKKELEFEECLKQQLEFICGFAKVTPIFINSVNDKIEMYEISKIKMHVLLHNYF